MIDTHCHILSEYYGDISNLIEQIKASGVEAIIINGTVGISVYDGYVSYTFGLSSAF